MQSPMRRYMYLCRYFYRISFLRRNFQLSRTRIDKINKYENLRQKFGYFSAIPSDLWLLTFAAEFIEKSIVASNATCRKKKNWEREYCLLCVPNPFGFSANHLGLQLQNWRVTPSNLAGKFMQSAVRYLKQSQSRCSKFSSRSSSYWKLGVRAGHCVVLMMGKEKICIKLRFESKGQPRPQANSILFVHALVCTN